MAKQKTRHDEGGRKTGKSRPRRPSARNKQQGAKGGNRAKANAAQGGCTWLVVPCRIGSVYLTVREMISLSGLPMALSAIV
jgi:hypothetical protein